MQSRSQHMYSFVSFEYFLSKSLSNWRKCACSFSILCWFRSWWHQHQVHWWIHPVVFYIPESVWVCDVFEITLMWMNIDIFRFSPSVFLYLGSVVPGILILEIDRIDRYRGNLGNSTAAVDKAQEEIGLSNFQGVCHNLITLLISSLRCRTVKVMATRP